MVLRDTEEAEEYLEVAEGDGLTRVVRRDRDISKQGTTWVCATPAAMLRFVSP